MGHDPGVVLRLPRTFHLHRPCTFTGSIGYNGITVIVIPIVSYFTWTFTGAKGQGQAGWTSFGFIVALLG